MKRILTGFLLLAGAALSACWGTAESYDKAFIYAVNNFVRTPLANLSYPPTFQDGGNVSFPATINVRISPRETGNPVTKAVLQYRVGESGEWTTAVTMDNPKWDMDITTPRPVFGIDTIKINPIPAQGTKVYIRMYLTDGVYETFNLEENDTPLGAFTCYVTSTGRAVPQLAAVNALIEDANGQFHKIQLASIVFTNDQEQK